MDFTSFLSLNRLGEVEDVANLIEFLLSDKSSFITGATLNIDGGGESGPENMEELWLTILKSSLWFLSLSTRKSARW